MGGHKTQCTIVNFSKTYRDLFTRKPRLDGIPYIFTANRNNCVCLCATVPRLIQTLSMLGRHPSELSYVRDAISLA